MKGREGTPTPSIPSQHRVTSFSPTLLPHPRYLPSIASGAHFSLPYATCECMSAMQLGRDTPSAESLRLHLPLATAGLQPLPGWDNDIRARILHAVKAPPLESGAGNHGPVHASASGASLARPAPGAAQPARATMTAITSAAGSFVLLWGGPHDDVLVINTRTGEHVGTLGHLMRGFGRPWGCMEVPGSGE